MPFYKEASKQATLGKKKKCSQHFLCSKAIALVVPGRYQLAPQWKTFTGTHPSSPCGNWYMEQDVTLHKSCLCVDPHALHPAQSCSFTSEAWRLHTDQHAPSCLPDKARLECPGNATGSGRYQGVCVSTLSASVTVSAVSDELLLDTGLA